MRGWCFLLVLLVGAITWSMPTQAAPCPHAASHPAHFMMHGSETLSALGADFVSKVPQKGWPEHVPAAAGAECCSIGLAFTAVAEQRVIRHLAGMRERRLAGWIPPLAPVPTDIFRPPRLG